MIVYSVFMRFRLPEKKVEAIGTRSTELARKSSNSGNSGSVCAGTLQRGESSLYKMLKRE